MCVCVCVCVYIYIYIIYNIRRARGSCIGTGAGCSSGRDAAAGSAP